ncbi:ABC transporter substrate-binding protein [Acrocarpospora catenulata]|uniref:ABC transporter substrate-binding protein n=1 Tax=Acrocarpospora catenulata TaxID=2836182 RepID=UPI001BDA9B2B|nr:ABC transporter substrate-binding protein [Acrocarpospora catenulata]
MTDEVTTIWYTRCPVPTASGVALDTGRLAARLAGLTVAPLRASGVTEAHFDHRLPALFREGGNVPALWARSRGERTRLVGLTWVPELQAVVTRRDSGITGPGDLAGRRLILPTHGGERVDFFRAMALRGFDATLRSAGLALADAVLVDAPAPLPQTEDVGADGFYGATVAALRAGLGDAAYVKGAPGADVMAYDDLVCVHDLNRTADPRLQINNGTPRTLTVSADLADRRPDLVARYIAALRDAARWAAGHPEETAGIVAAETGSTRAGVARGYGDTLHHRLEPELRPEWIAYLEDQKRFLLHHGVLPHDFAIGEWIDPGPLAASDAYLTTDTEDIA